MQAEVVRYRNLYTTFPKEDRKEKAKRIIIRAAEYVAAFTLTMTLAGIVLMYLVGYGI